MNCKEFEPEISAYLDDELSESQKTAVIEHLKSCTACQALLDTFRDEQLSIEEIKQTYQKVKTNPDYLKNLLLRVKSEKPSISPLRRFFSLSKDIWKWELATAAGLLLVLAFVIFGPSPYNKDEYYIPEPGSRYLVKSAGKEKWVTPPANYQFKKGDTVKTESKIAQIRLPDKTTVQLRENTEIELKGKEQKQEVINLQKGEVYIETSNPVRDPVREKKQVTSKIKVETAAGEIIDKGTKFNVRIEPQKGDNMKITTTLFALVMVTVMEGQVLFTNPYGEQIVNAGETAIAQPAAKPGLLAQIQPSDQVKQSETAQTILKGLDWLAKHQEEDGSWKAGRSDFNTGVTGLTLLAFLQAGFTHQNKDELKYNELVSRGLKFLISQQNKDGSIGDINIQKALYNHAISTYALAKAYELTKDNELKKPSKKALDYLLNAQNPGKAWRYKPRNGDNDMSVTSWCVQALKTAQEGKLIKVDKTVWDGVKSHLDDVTDLSYGGVGYREKGNIAILGSEKEKFERGELYTPPSLTAVGMMCRIFMGQKRSDTLITNSADMLTQDGNFPKWDANTYGKIDYYYWYYGTQALLAYSERDGQEFHKWETNIELILISNQEKDGNWKQNDRWSAEGGNTYVAAINLLTLETCYGKHITNLKIPESPAPKITPELEEKIKALIIQLDDDDWKKRESAQAQLIKIGEPAISYLHETKKNNTSPEVQMRVKNILNEIE